MVRKKLLNNVKNHIVSLYKNVSGHAAKKTLGERIVAHLLILDVWFKVSFLVFERDMTSIILWDLGFIPTELLWLWLQNMILWRHECSSAPRQGVKVMVDSIYDF